MLSLSKSATIGSNLLPLITSLISIGQPDLIEGSVEIVEISSTTLAPSFRYASTTIAYSPPVGGVSQVPIYSPPVYSPPELRVMPSSFLINSPFSK